MNLLLAKRYSFRWLCHSRASVIYPARLFGRQSILFDLVYGLVAAWAACWVAASESRIYEDTLALTGQAWQFNVFDWFAGFVLIVAAIDFQEEYLVG